MISPGTYLRLRREAAGLTVEDLALRFETIPHWSVRQRSDWVASIEADVAPVSPGTAVALRWFIRFDPHVLDALIARHAGYAVGIPDICIRCGCSEYDACEGACCWADPEHTLCSSCIDQPGRGSIPTAALKPEQTT